MKSKEVTEILPYSEFPTYQENPFKEDLVMHMTTKSKNKIRKYATNDIELIESSTGLAVDKEADNFFVGTISTVDKEQFTKIYKGAIQLMTDITGKAINVFMWYIFPKLTKDSLQIIFNLEECMKITDLSRPTIYAALSELINAGLIAKSELNWLFYINPVYIFNGDRIRIVNEYRREGSERNQAQSKLEKMYDPDDDSLDQ